MKFVPVFTTFYPTEADLVASRLEVAGFNVNIANEYSALTFPPAVAAGGIRVEVPEDQAGDARAFIESTIKAKETLAGDIQP